MRVCNQCNAYNDDMSQECRYCHTAMPQQPLYPPVQQGQPTYPPVQQGQPMYPPVQQGQPTYPPVQQQPTYPPVQQGQPTYPPVQQGQPTYPPVQQGQPTYPPVQQQPTYPPTYPQQPYQNPYNYSPFPPKPPKKRIIAGILALILGGLGAQKFYLGKPGQGLLCLALSWTTIPSLIGILEGIRVLCLQDEQFAEIYDPPKKTPTVYHSSY